MQGDKERQHGFEPDGLHDRKLANLTPKNQKGFISVFIVPFHTLVADMFEKMVPVRELAKQNFEYWLEKCDEDEARNTFRGGAKSPGPGEKSASRQQVANIQKSPDGSIREEGSATRNRLTTWLEHQRKHLPHLKLRKTADLDTADAIRSTLGMTPNAMSYMHKRHHTGSSRVGGRRGSPNSRLNRRRSTGSARSLNLIMAELGEGGSMGTGKAGQEKLASIRRAPRVSEEV
jgi:hypothetical protein